ncbi:MAG: hypothetical protein IPP14_06240 [Planctomycetes bacterium]|nr:hypothetical protein [Planctomycetota bacterium]
MTKGQQHPDPATHHAKLGPAQWGLRLGLVALIVGLIVLVPLISAWDLFGPAIHHELDHPSTVVRSRAEIDSLPPYVDRIAAPELTDDDIAYLVAKTSCSELDLGDNTHVTDAAVKHASRMDGLTDLSLIGTAVTDEGIKHLRTTKLTYLAVWHTAVGDRGLGYISEIRTMKQLQCKDCQSITDSGVAKLVNLPDLRVLNLGQCRRVTDKSLAVLAEMPALQLIQVYETGVTDKGIKRYQTQRPQSEVHYWR